MNNINFPKGAKENILFKMYDKYVNTANNDDKIKGNEEKIKLKAALHALSQDIPGTDIKGIDLTKLGKNAVMKLYDNIMKGDLSDDNANKIYNKLLEKESKERLSPNERWLLGLIKRSTIKKIVNSNTKGNNEGMKLISALHALSQDIPGTDIKGIDLTKLGKNAVMKLYDNMRKGDLSDDNANKIYNKLLEKESKERLSPNERWLLDSIIKTNQ